MPMSRLPFIVVITTSGRRTQLLLERALPSVLSQSRQPSLCIIVDDNDDDTEIIQIQKTILGIKERKLTFDILCVKNERTKGFSGTGAWNTGINYARQYLNTQSFSDAYIAILDDDDYWEDCHLEKCDCCRSRDTLAIFPNLTRIYADYKEPGSLNSVEQLIIDNFLVGNPGVQGSNMCLLLSALESIGGFDESLKSCTDRDLMIRFLEKFGNSRIRVFTGQTVMHDASSPHCVTNSIVNKTQGLDVFYSRHLHRFSESTLQKSLHRAERLFSYPNSRFVWNRFYQAQEVIAVLMPLRNSATTLRASVESYLSQKKMRRSSILIIGNDGSTDHWQECIGDLLSIHHNIVVVDIDGGNVSRARNELYRYVHTHYPKAYCICRLDSDDVFYSEETLSQIEALFENEDIDIVLGSNLQTKDGLVVGENRAELELLNKDYLRQRLYDMSLGIASAELPSCNLCTRANLRVCYPDEESAEDHWLLVWCLINIPSERICISHRLIYCCYNLNGSTTNMNKSRLVYIDSRIRLYEYYRTHAKH